MGMRCTVSITVKVNIVQHILDLAGCGHLVHYEPGLAWMTASDVKAALEVLSGYSAPDADVYEASMTWLLLNNHARDYISKSADEANVLGLSGGTRKDFLRRKTQEYRLVFA